MKKLRENHPIPSVIPIVTVKRTATVTTTPRLSLVPVLTAEQHLSLTLSPTVEAVQTLALLLQDFTFDEEEYRLVGVDAEVIDGWARGLKEITDAA